MHRGNTYRSATRAHRDPVAWLALGVLALILGLLPQATGAAASGGSPTRAPLTGSITGHVTDETGAPIVGATVDATSYDDYAAAETDESGAYRLTGLPAGDYVVQFEADGFLLQYFGGGTDWETATPVNVVAGGEASGIDAVLGLGGSISGSVADETGAPIEGVTISAIGYEHWGAAETDASGTYRLTGFPAGDYVVQFQMDGYLAQYFDGVSDWEAATPVTVATGGEVSGIDAVLARGASISGTVTDASGQPVAEVEVAVEGDAGYGWVTTAEDGSYTASGLRPGSYTVSFFKPGFLRQYYDGADWDTATAVSVVAANDEVSGIDAVLARGASISGTVTDASGQPVAEVEVAVEGDAGYGWVTTAEDGSYTAPGLRPGSYTVSFSKAGYLRQYYDGADWDTATAVSVVAANDEVSGIDAVLARGASISGTVTDASGEPLDGVSVAAFDYPFGQLEFTTTAADGSYTVPGLRPGSYAMQFVRAGYVTQYFDAVTSFGDWTAVVVTGEDPVSGIDAALDREASISGTVTDASGRPLAGVTVSVDGPSMTGSSTEDDGTYTVSGLAAGTYTVSFERFGYLGQLYGGSAATPVTVSVGAEVTGIDAVLEPGRESITGRVTDADGAPISGATVDASGPDASAQVTTRADGTYRFVDLEPGWYFVRFSAEGYDDGYVFTVVEEGWTASGTDVMLYPAPVVSDLVVAVSASAPEVAVGDTLTYRLSVSELGEGPATDVVVTDTVPDEFEVVSARRGWFGLPCDIDGRAVACSIPSLSGTNFVDVTVRALTPGSGVENTASVSGAGFDPDPWSNSSSVSVDVVADRVPVDLAVTARASTAEAAVGETFTYVLDVRNPSRQVATGVVVTDTVPDDVEVISATRGFLGVPCAVDGRDVTCELGSVATSQFVVIEVRAVTAGTDIENEATVTADTPDPVTANNRATASVDVTEVAAPVDVALHTYASATSVRVGETFTYSLMVDNTGSRSVDGVSVTDAVPVNFEVLSVGRGWFGTSCGVPNQTVTCALGTVADYQFVTVTVRALAPGEGIVNSASVAVAGGDSDPSNDSSSVAVTVTP